MVTKRISEAELIEMHSRMRRLESAIEDADLILASAAEVQRNRMKKADDQISNERTYESACRTISAAEAELDRLTQIRERVERGWEACFEDMNAMQDLIRGTM